MSKRYPDGPLNSASFFAAVTKSDSTEVTSNGNYPRALFVGTGGDLVLTPADGSSSVTFKNVADGTILDVVAKKVHATGSTAADIVALY